MVLDRETLERIVSTEEINKIISKIQKAPEGTVMIKTKYYKNKDDEETI